MSGLPLPPDRLRFMGESDAEFLPICDRLADGVLARLDGRNRFDLLDIGCGYGRLAYGLDRAGFTGRYDGFDILREHVAWLDGHFVPSEEEARFRFACFNVHNARYNPSGMPFETLDIPYADASMDCVAAFSVFTHMYEEDIASYLRRFGRVLRDDGMWIATFFCVPDDFELERQDPLMRYRLTRQIAPDVFIHDPAEPLHVIAYRERHLRRLIEAQGLEVVELQRGHWLAPGTDGEFQDWFVLRKKVRTELADAAAAAPVSAPSCNICGGTEFGPGPGGRMAASGLPPYCKACGSLERQRIQRTVLQALPIGFLDWRRCLQFSPDQTPNPAWFRSHELSIYGGANSLDIQEVARPDGSYDFITLSHVLECIPHDLKAFDELMRLLTPRGILHAGLAGATRRERSVDFDHPVDPYGTLHLYGGDVWHRFGCAARGVAMLVVEGTDAVTGTVDVGHFFARDPADIARMRRWMLAWHPSIRMVGEALP